MENSISSQFRFNPPVSEEWRSAVEMLPSNIAITPFVGKCLYFVGVARHVVDAASRLFESQYNLPALLLVSTIVELLGRCLLGDDDHFQGDKKRLKTGFKKLVKSVSLIKKTISWLCKHQVTEPILKKIWLLCETLGLMASAGHISQISK